MSGNNKRKLAAIITTLLVSCSIIYVFDPFVENVRYSPVGLSDFRYTGSYKINPETILASLDRGERDVFMLEIATPGAPVFEEIIPWRQSDHLRIANALHQFVWKESLDSWNLYYMNFVTACQDNPRGFALGDFYYFKIIFTYGKLRYTARELLISQQYSHVTWGGGANFPYPLPAGWESVNLKELKITAEDTLRIAEENGGEVARLSVQNECTIRVRLSGYDPNWRVRISDDRTASELFRIAIDPYTGEIE